MLYDFHIDLRLDSSHALYFKLPTSDPKVGMPKVDAELEWAGDVFYITEVEATREGSTTFVSVTAAALWQRLGENQVPGTVSLVNVTPAQGLALILAQTVIGTGAWTTGAATTTSGSVYSADYTDQTVLAMLRDWAVVTGTFLVFNTAERKVDLTVARGVDRGVPFWYKRNVLSILRRSTAPTVTVLYPYGKDDLTIAGLNGNAYLEDFSWYTAQGMTLPEARARYTKRKVLAASNIVDETALLALGQRTLAALAKGEVHYEAKVVDLTGQTDLPVGDLLTLRPGDICGVRDDVLGWNVSTTLVRMDVYPTDPGRNVVELATLPETAPNLGAASRSDTNNGRILFQDGSGRVILRNGGTWITNRIPIRFQAGGDAVFGLSVRAVGAGTGSLSVSALDAETGLLVRPAFDLPYTGGQVSRTTETWSDDDLGGQRDYRIRVQAVSTGGASPASGIDMQIDDTWFWILALGATRQSPVSPNSQTFNYTGAIQTFTVPDNITEVTFFAKGGQGGFQGGFGGTVQATYSVTPGARYDVYVGGGQATGHGNRWPNGGQALASAAGDVAGGNGGASSHVIAQGGLFSAALLVAPGGGGRNEPGPSRPNGVGGIGAFFVGGNGDGLSGTNTPHAGGGATQYAGGHAGDNGGAAGSFGLGGDSADTGNSFHFGGGGGGGGWYGGGGAGYPTLFGGGSYAGDGGGGTGWVSAAGFNVITEDGAQSGNGQVVVTWENQDT